MEKVCFFKSVNKDPRTRRVNHRTLGSTFFMPESLQSLRTLYEEACFHAKNRYGLDRFYLEMYVQQPSNRYGAVRVLVFRVKMKDAIPEVQPLFWDTLDKDVRHLKYQWYYSDASYIPRRPQIVEPRPKIFTDSYQNIVSANQYPRVKAEKSPQHESEYGRMRNPGQGYVMALGKIDGHAGIDRSRRAKRILPQI